MNSDHRGFGRCVRRDAGRTSSPAAGGPAAALAHAGPCNAATDDADRRAHLRGRSPVDRLSTDDAVGISCDRAFGNSLWHLRSRNPDRHVVRHGAWARLAVPLLGAGSPGRARR